MKAHAKLVVIVVAVLLAGILIGRWWAGGASPASVQDEGAAEAAVKFWTCSMHPEIQLPDPGLCPKCRMDLIPVMESDEADPTSLRELRLSPAAQALASVETARVERRFVASEIRMVGKVDFDETKLAYLTAWIPGRLDRLYVDYTGVSVNKGDHMVYIYSPELLSAQEELIQAIETVRRTQGSDLDLVKERARATVESSREKLRLWGLAEEQVAKIEDSGKADDHLTIYSPISGIVIHKNALEGGYVKTGTRIYTIADLSHVWIKLDAYESDLSAIHYGQDVAFETEVHPGRIFHGTVAFIDPVLNEKTRTVKVRVNVDNEHGELKPGMFVRATVRSRMTLAGRTMDPDLAGQHICPMHLEIIKDAPGDCDICGMPLVTTEEKFGLAATPAGPVVPPLVIPVSAALITGRRAIVYVKSPAEDGLFEGREIVLGPRAGDYYLVRRGLAAGDMIVVKGAFKLDAELQIRAKPSMMTPEGGGVHDHGESASTPGSEPSSLTRAQLHAVLDAAQAVDGLVAAGDLREIRAAFAAVVERVDAVATDVMGDAVVLLWKEYAMLLGNDGEEGRTVETLADAGRIAASLREHAASMRRKMGLAKDRAGAAEPAVSAEFVAQFGHVVDGYIATQTALAGDDFGKATAAVKEMLAALADVDMRLLSDADHDAWMPHANALKDALTKMAAAAEIDASRELFSPISERMMTAARRFGAPAGPLYQFKCPMALGGEGATWIQDHKATRNPYYGASMLECGAVVDALAGAAAPETPAAPEKPPAHEGSAHEGSAHEGSGHD